MTKHAGQFLANGTYRCAARAMAAILGWHGIVESVYVHRSVAKGEVHFGKSDIDLILYVRQPEPGRPDGAALASLYQWVRLLRKLNPALGHILVQEFEGPRRSFRVDSYGASLIRRGAIRLMGAAPPMPYAPVRREDAVRFFTVWAENLFSLAVRQTNRRNLTKVAWEMWNAFAVARAEMDEPCRTFEESLNFIRAEAIGVGLADVVRRPEHAPRFIFGMAKQLHDELFAPLAPLAEPLVFRAPLLPSCYWRTLVVAPDGGCAFPKEAYAADSFIATPELLHLYCHFANPFAFWRMPLLLSGIGFVPPSPHSFLNACLNLQMDFSLRFPGFLYPHTWPPAMSVAFVEHSIPYLQKGRTPPPAPDQVIREVLRRQPSVSDYYERYFPALYRQAVRQWAALDEMSRQRR